MIMTILVLALAAGLVGLIATASRRLQGRRADGQMFRRAFQYALLYALVDLVATGTADLLGRLLSQRPDAWRDDALVLAESLTFVLVGLPLAAALAWWTWRSHRRDPGERASLLYAAYLTAASLTGAAMTAAKLHGVIATAVGSGAFNPAAAAGVVAWGAMWLAHWFIIRRTLTPSEAGPHLLLGSAIGLVLAASGLVAVLGSSLDLLTGASVIVGERFELGSAAGLLLSGGLVWGLYWPTRAASLPRGTAWHACVLLLGVTGGLLTALVGAQGLGWRALVQLVGDPASMGPWIGWPHEVGALVVGTLVWWYHRNILGAVGRTGVRRVYEYLVSGIGIGAAAFGVGIVIVSLIEASTPSVDLGYTSLNLLLAALTLLIIGIPLWWAHWRQAQRALKVEPGTEAASVPRRVFLIVVLGVASVAVVIALIVVGAGIAQDALAGELDLTTLRKVRTPIGVIGAGLGVIAYHGAVLRQDKGVPRPPAGPRPASVTLVGPACPSLLAAITERSGRPVRLLEIEAGRWNEESVLSQVSATDDLLIIAREGAEEVHRLKNP